MGEHAVSRHFFSCSLPQKTRENSRRMTENVCEFFVLPLENTKKRDVKSLENGGEQRNTILSSCVNRMFSLCFACINRALTVRLTQVKQAFSWC